MIRLLKGVNKPKVKRPSFWVFKRDKANSSERWMEEEEEEEEESRYLKFPLKKL